MAVFKCKMCGGTIEFEQGATVGVCDSCGSRQTLPKLDDDKKANLYDRANHFRRNNDYDKAMGIYEQILNEDGSDAEAYWSLVLCRYGIEYVEDPATHKRVPTVNRAQFTSIFDDEDYKSALAHADMTQKMIYEEEAATINEIQKGILAISQKEEPFDVFICYKETDNDGRRTQDSVLANDLYHQLTQEGFKVFFSRITLEDKLGTAYEPYIFAALNSAKVMVVLGTKPEYFNAVWVKNEWSRYLALIRNGAKKMLIPAYRDMDPYDLPEEFSHLQAQDMSKLGFMQDLIRGIKKIVGTDEPKQTVKETVVVNSGNANTEPLLKRAFMFLEDGNWQEADEYCERVLDIDPECAEAYLGKLMAEKKVCNQEDLKNCEIPISESNNYSKAVRYGNEQLVKQLSEYEELLQKKILEPIYIYATKLFESAETYEEYEKAAKEFDKCINYNDASEKRAKCLEVIEREDKKIGERVDAILVATKGSMLKKKIQDLKNEQQELYPLCDSYPEIKREVDDLNHQVQKLEDARKDLEDKRSNIGMFAMKEKKIIDAQIEEKIVSIKSLYSKISLCNMKLKGHSSKESIESRISEIERDISKIEKNMPKSSISMSEQDALDEYHNSEIIRKAVDEREPFLKFMFAEVGESVFLGSYPPGFQRETIEWQVLEKQETRALLISKYALDIKKYNEENVDCTWESCTLREWLNNEFLNSSFTAGERARIPMVTVTTDKNPRFKTDPGNSTEDQVFLLSINEANKYFRIDERICNLTSYAFNQAGGIGRMEKAWWLRSPGYSQKFAAIVDHVGNVKLNGTIVFDSFVAIRPAMWISIE